MPCLTIPQEVRLRELRHRALLASWEEAKHPRDDDGKFAETEGGSSTGAAPLSEGVYGADDDGYQGPLLNPFPVVFRSAGESNPRAIVPRNFPYELGNALNRIAVERYMAGPDARPTGPEPDDRATLTADDMTRLREDAYSYAQQEAWRRIGARGYNEWSGYERRMFEDEDEVPAGAGGRAPKIEEAAEAFRRAAARMGLPAGEAAAEWKRRNAEAIKKSEQGKKRAAKARQTAADKARAALAEMPPADFWSDPAGNPLHALVEQRFRQILANNNFDAAAIGPDARARTVEEYGKWAKRLHGPDGDLKKMKRLVAKKAHKFIKHIDADTWSSMVDKEAARYWDRLAANG